MSILIIIIIIITSHHKVPLVCVLINWHHLFQDMAKWAKTMNAQKNAMKGGAVVPMTMPYPAEMPIMRQERSSLTADAGFAIMEKVVR